MSTLPAQSRTNYRATLAHRRTITFLVIFAFLTVIFFSGVLVATGTVQAPFNPAFKHGPIKPDYYTVPCPPKNTQPAPLSRLTVNVYNTTDQAGLAGNTAKELQKRGITVDHVGNSDTTVTGTANIQTSVHSIREAYTLAELIPESTITLLPTDPLHPTQLTLQLGTAFEKLITSEAYDALEPTRTFATAGQCEPVDELFIQDEATRIQRNDTPEATPAGSPETTAENKK